MQCPQHELDTLDLNLARKETKKFLEHLSWGQKEVMQHQDSRVLSTELSLTCLSRWTGYQWEFSKVRLSGINGVMKEVIRRQGKAEVQLGRMVWKLFFRYLSLLFLYSFLFPPTFSSQLPQPHLNPNVAKQLLLPRADSLVFLLKLLSIKLLLPIIQSLGGF